MKRKRKYVPKANSGINDCGVYIVVPTLAVPALELVSRYDFGQSKAYTKKQ